MFDTSTEYEHKSMRDYKYIKLSLDMSTEYKNKSMRDY